MGYGLEQHETVGYKSPHTISPALMKREAVLPLTLTHTTDFVQFLHPAPAEEIFKDPLWVTLPPSFIGVGSSKWVLKIFRGGLQ